MKCKDVTIGQRIIFDTEECHTTLHHSIRNKIGLVRTQTSFHEDCFEIEFEDNPKVYKGNVYNCIYFSPAPPDELEIFHEWLTNGEF